MENKSISCLLFVILMALFTIGIIVCAWWYPFSVSLTVRGVAIEPEIASQYERISFYTQFVFYELVSLPCFIIIILGLILSIRFMKGNLFTDNSTKIIKFGYILFGVDLILFFIGNLVFLLLEWNDFFFIYIILFIVGVVFELLMFISYRAFINNKENKELIEGIV